MHCAMGISRSASTIIAYLMWKQRLGFAEAASQVGAWGHGGVGSDRRRERGGAGALRVTDGGRGGGRQPGGGVEMPREGGGNCRAAKCSQGKVWEAEGWRKKGVQGAPFTSA